MKSMLVFTPRAMADLIRSMVRLFFYIRQDWKELEGMNSGISTNAVLKI